MRGSAALRAAIISIFNDEVAVLSGIDVAKILWDMAKFYDNIDICKLIDFGLELDYDSRMLILGVMMHMAPRVLKAYDQYTQCEMPNNGIIAGCTQSNIFARLLLYTVMAAAMQRHDGQVLRSFVDDINQTMYGQDEDETSLEDRMVVAATDVANELKSIGCVISDKSMALSNKTEIGKNIAKRLKLRRIPMKFVKVAKDLGVGTSA